MGCAVNPQKAQPTTGADQVIASTDVIEDANRPVVAKEFTPDDLFKLLKAGDKGAIVLVSFVCFIVILLMAEGIKSTR